MAFVKVCNTSDIEEGKGGVFNTGDKEIAVFKWKGDFLAIGNACPHQGGPLGEGELYEEDEKTCGVICPLHGYMFNIATGEGMSFPTGVPTYKVKVEGNDVLVDV